MHKALHGCSVAENLKSMYNHLYIIKESGYLMWKDFKQFAVKGNVMDLAVAVVIGAAFGKIVSSLVDDIIMPAVGLLLGGVSFEDLSYVAGDSELKYGLFIQSIVDFFIIAFSIFLVVRFIQKFKRKEEEVEEAPPVEEVDEQTELLKEIRDLLKK